MEEKEKIQIAYVALNKKMDYETLKYSDYLYGREVLVDEVWEIVLEAELQGMRWFKETYKDFL